MNNPIAVEPGSGIPATNQTAHTLPKESLGHAISLAIVGLIAAVLSLIAIRQTGRVFELPNDLLNMKFLEGRNQSPEVMQRFYDGLIELNYKHAALWIGIAGSIVGVLFGLALGVMRGSRASIVSGALGGLILGCLLSACGGLVANCLGENIVSQVRKEKTEVPAHYAMLLHGATFLVVGLGIGLGTGLGATKNRIAAALSSMVMAGIAGAAGGAFYPFVASLAMPFVDPSLTIPEGDFNRMVWLGLPFVSMGLALGRRV